MDLRFGHEPQPEHDGGPVVSRKPAYPGPEDRLTWYRELVEAHPEAELKGAKNPYTSRNGWMTSFLDPDGCLCLRLPADDRARTEAEFGGTAVRQYGRNMPEFVLVPREGPTDADVGHWFARSWDWVGTKPPK